MRIVLTIPRRLSHCVAAADAPEREAFANIPRALVKEAVDRAQLAGAVQPRDRRAVGTQDLPALVAPRSALGVEHRRGELDRVVRRAAEAQQHLPAPEID